MLASMLDEKKAARLTECIFDLAEDFTPTSKHLGNQSKKIRKH
jgi:hypothetical protein